MRKVVVAKLRELVQQHNPNYVFLMETKSDSAKVV